MNQNDLSQCTVTIPVTLDTASLTRRLQNSSGKRVSQRLRKSIEKAVVDIQKYTHPRGIYSIRPLMKPEKKYISISGFTIRSRKLEHVLRPCQDAALFIATLGADIEKLIAHQMQQNIAYGYVLDQATSLAAERAAMAVHAQLAKKIPPNSKLTHRYSPGYCDWPIMEQKNFFQVFNGKKIDVKLNEYALMSPKKSISGIIGICRNAGTEFKTSACSFCQKKCQYQRKESAVAYVR